MTQKFVIHPEEEKLIEAAINLGNWIICQPDITEDQKIIIQEVQAAFRKLPEATFGLNACYEFRANNVEIDNWNGKEPVPEGEERLWSAGYYQGQDANGRLVAVIEIFNIFHPLPRGYYEEFAGEEMELSIYKISYDASTANSKQEYQITEWQRARINDWITDTQNPQKFQRDGINFSIEVDKWYPASRL